MAKLVNKSEQMEIYLMIPIEYVPLYRKLLICLSDIGEDILKTCDSTCKCSKAKVVIAHAHNSQSDRGILKEIIHSFNKKFIPFLANNYFACSKDAAKWFFSKKVRNSKNFYILNE